jgi:hypothetical protein
VEPRRRHLQGGGTAGYRSGMTTLSGTRSGRSSERRSGRRCVPLEPWHVQCQGSPADWGVVVQARGEDGDEDEEDDKDVTIISIDAVADHAPTPLSVRLRAHTPCVLSPSSVTKLGDCVRATQGQCIDDERPRRAGPCG